MINVHNRFFVKINYFLKSLSELEKKIHKSDEHPNVLISMGDIARTWSAIGEHHKALEQFVKVLGNY